MTEKEFAEKVMWEGGVWDALEYGLRAEDCEPGELRNEYAFVQSAYDDINEQVDAVEQLVERALGDQD